MIKNLSSEEFNLILTLDERATRVVSAAMELNQVLFNISLTCPNRMKSIWNVDQQKLNEVINQIYANNENINKFFDKMIDQFKGENDAIDYFRAENRLLEIGHKNQLLIEETNLNNRFCWTERFKNMCEDALRKKRNLLQFHFKEWISSSKALERGRMKKKAFACLWYDVPATHLINLHHLLENFWLGLSNHNPKLKHHNVGILAKIIQLGIMGPKNCIYLIFAADTKFVFKKDWISAISHNNNLARPFMIGFFNPKVSILNSLKKHDLLSLKWARKFVNPVNGGNLDIENN